MTTDEMYLMKIKSILVFIPFIINFLLSSLWPCSSTSGDEDELWPSRF